MTRAAAEFLRRFYLHILPPGFRKVRYYGFMAHVNIALLQVQQKDMGVVAMPDTHSIYGEGKGEAKKAFVESNCQTKTELRC